MAKDVYVAFLALVLAAFLVLGFQAACPIYAAQKKPVILVSVDTADFCSACPKLMAELKSNNAETAHSETTGNAEYYPLCTYSNGTSDYGQRVYAKKCGFARPVKIIKHKDSAK